MMFVGLLFFFNPQFMTLTQAVMECNPTDSLFIETKDGIVVESGQWKDVSKFDGDQRCISKCHFTRRCNSAITNETHCTLRDVNRMDVGSQMIKTPKTKYFEKQKCTAFLPNERFIALVSDTVACKDIYNKGWKVSGIYGVNKVGDNTYQPIKCEMSLLGGGWTVVQSRIDGSVDFNRNWTSYKEGFGELDGNFWYGNDRLHNLTKDQTNEIVVFLEIENNAKYYPMYDEFQVAGEEDKYKVTVGNYVPVLGTDLSQIATHYKGFERHNQLTFSTPDIDNDGLEDKHCASMYSSGWWFDHCYSVSLNGIHGQSDNSAIAWDQLTWLSSNIQKFTSKVKMMVRKKSK